MSDFGVSLHWKGFSHLCFLLRSHLLWFPSANGHCSHWLCFHKIKAKPQAVYLNSQTHASLRLTSLALVCFFLLPYFQRHPIRPQPRLPPGPLEAHPFCPFSPFFWKFLLLWQRQVSVSWTSHADNSSPNV